MPQYDPRRRRYRAALLLLGDGGLEEGEKRRVLAQQILDLRDTRARPVLDPRLGQVVLDVMEATLVHEIDDRPDDRARQWARWLILGAASAYCS